MLPKEEHERSQRVGAVDVNGHGLAAQLVQLQHCETAKPVPVQQTEDDFGSGPHLVARARARAREGAPPKSNEVPADAMVPGRKVTAATTKVQNEAEDLSVARK